MGGMRVWVNGEIVADGQGAISPLDHGVTVGDGAFETLKVINGQPFAARRHRERLSRSLAGLGLPEADDEQLATGIAAVLAGDPSMTLGRLRYTVTGGVGPAGSERTEAPLTHIVAAAAIDPPAASARIFVTSFTRNERSATAGLKTTSYAENVVALAQARHHNADEALMANTRGHLCEGTGSNVFVVVGGQVVTPTLTSGALAGVTRELVLEWGQQAGVEMVERTLDLDSLNTADEVFITSSTRDVMPVTAIMSAPGLGIQGRDLAIGPVTQQLQSIFATETAREVDP